MVDNTNGKEASDFVLESKCIEDPGLRAALERARSAYIERQVSEQGEKVRQSFTDNALIGEPAKQLEFFSLELIDYAFKDDPASMEAPLYSLSTKKDTSTWRWQSEDGNKNVEVTCNAEYGRATQHDKDILIYCMSQLTAASKYLPAKPGALVREPLKAA